MYKKTMLLVLFLALIITNGALSQKIIRRTNKFVLIEIAPQSETKIGDQFDVYRNNPKYQDRKIGRIKILKFQGGKCAGEITIENEKLPIASGDFVKLYQSQTQLYIKKSNNMPRYLSIGAGIMSCGLGYSFYDKANNIYGDYKSAKKAEDATRLYNDAVKYDKNTNIALGVGTGLIVLGIIYPLIKSNSAANPKFAFNIYSNYDKIQLTVNLSLNLY
jgi:hypothetical protein